jgi:hypothetical protein
MVTHVWLMQPYELLLMRPLCDLARPAFLLLPNSRQKVVAEIDAVARRLLNVCEFASLFQAEENAC